VARKTAPVSTTRPEILAKSVDLVHAFVEDR